MSRWFRHYAGLCRDDKLVRVALKAKQPVERVVWVWAAILESASEVDDHGRFDFDVGEASYFLRADEADVASICSALECLGRISAGTVAKWDDRQFVSDRSAERQQRYRNKQKERREHNGDGQVTSLSRNGDAPELETETDIELASASSKPSAQKPTPRSILLECLSPETADGVVAHRKAKRSPLTPLAAQQLVKGFLATGDPEAAATMMVARGWQGFKPEWFENDRSDGRKLSVQEAAVRNAERGVTFGPIPPRYMPSGRSEPASGGPAGLLPEGRSGEPRDLRERGGGGVVLLPGGDRLPGDGPEGRVGRDIEMVADGGGGPFRLRG